MGWFERTQIANCILPAASTGAKWGRILATHHLPGTTSPSFSQITVRHATQLLAGQKFARKSGKISQLLPTISPLSHPSSTIAPERIAVTPYASVRRCARRHPMRASHTPPAITDRSLSLKHTPPHASESFRPEPRASTKKNPVRFPRPDNSTPGYHL